VAAGIGALLAGAMGWLTVWFLFVLRQQGDPLATTRFTGGPVLGAMILVVFLFFLAFGLAMVRAGIFQLRTGGRDMRMWAWIPPAIGVVFGFWVCAEAAEMVRGW